jgi:DNA repair protein RadC
MGPNALTDAELLAILIRVGYRGTDAVELSRNLLKRFGSLQAMARAPVLSLLDVKGLKGAKAAQLVAAMEISRRVTRPESAQEMRFKTTAQGISHFRERLRGLHEEQFRVLFLNRRNALIDDVLIAQGTADSVSPSLRRIIALALQFNATGIIAAHNHPSGASEPSESDRLLTKELIAATRPLGLRVLDHVIVGDEGGFSFLDSGLLDELELECFAPGDPIGTRILSKGGD